MVQKVLEERSATFVSFAISGPTASWALKALSQSYIAVTGFATVPLILNGHPRKPGNVVHLPDLSQLYTTLKRLAMHISALIG